ncbi:MAG TPA: hypothetical protein PLD59_11080 [Tepidisphaeraceae bacterium]|nr:hypothetical protein [Tepidisphaeraceae bacterium]
MSETPSSVPPIDLSAARDSLRRQLLTKIEQNRAHLLKLQRDSRRVPFLLLLLLLTIPAGIFFGFAGVGVVIVATVFCLGSALYLVWGHKEEYHQRIAAAEQQLKKLSAPDFEGSQPQKADEPGGGAAGGFRR